MEKKILFVCVENSNRSQMSQAFALIHSGSQIEAYSAGSKPSGAINPKAIAAMKELGYVIAAGGGNIMVNTDMAGVTFGGRYVTQSEGTQIIPTSGKSALIIRR